MTFSHAGARLLCVQTAPPQDGGVLICLRARAAATARMFCLNAMTREALILKVGSHQHAN